MSSISSSLAKRDTPKEMKTVRAIRDRWAPRLTKGTCGLSTSPSGEEDGVEREKGTGTRAGRKGVTIRAQ